jgi:hypothetical protein
MPDQIQELDDEITAEDVDMLLDAPDGRMLIFRTDIAVVLEVANEIAAKRAAATNSVPDYWRIAAISPTETGARRV